MTRAQPTAAPDAADSLALVAAPPLVLAPVRPFEDVALNGRRFHMYAPGGEIAVRLERAYASTFLVCESDGTSYAISDFQNSYEECPCSEVTCLHPALVESLQFTTSLLASPLPKPNVNSGIGTLVTTAADGVAREFLYVSVVQDVSYVRLHYPATATIPAFVSSAQVRAPLYCQMCASYGRSYPLMCLHLTLAADAKRTSSASVTEALIYEVSQRIVRMEVKADEFIVRHPLYTDLSVHLLNDAKLGWKLQYRLAPLPGEADPSNPLNALHTVPLAPVFDATGTFAGTFAGCLCHLATGPCLPVTLANAMLRASRPESS